MNLTAQLFKEIIYLIIKLNAMENRLKKMTEEDNHRQDSNNKQRKKNDVAKSQAELEARLKTQEYKEMLKRLK